MTESDLTIKVLQGIREDLARTNRDTTERLDATNERLDAMRAESEAARRESNQRFEVIETALRGVGEQVVMLARLAELEQRSH